MHIVNYVKHINNNYSESGRRSRGNTFHGTSTRMISRSRRFSNDTIDGKIMTYRTINLYRYMQTEFITLSPLWKE